MIYNISENPDKYSPKQRQILYFQLYNKWFVKLPPPLNFTNHYMRMNNNNDKGNKNEILVSGIF